jgi:hypothetical protein
MPNEFNRVAADAAAAERKVTASPSISALSAARLLIASATFGNLSVKFGPKGLLGCHPYGR